MKNGKILLLPRRDMITDYIMVSVDEKATECCLQLVFDINGTILIIGCLIESNC